MTKSVVEKQNNQTKNKKEATAMKKSIFWKSAWETTKTILITALVAGIVVYGFGFNAGADYQKRQTEELKSQVTNIVSNIDKSSKE